MAVSKGNRLLAIAALYAALSGHGAAVAAESGAAPVPVIASFSIIADWLRVVGGERVAVTSLVPPDGDAHAFRATPKQVRTIAAARLIFINGLGFEGWLGRLLTAAGAQATVITLSDGATLRETTAGGFSARASADPHAWHSVPNAMIYVRNIVPPLCEADPAGCDGYRARADAYVAELTVLDAEIRDRFARVPPERRTVIASHDAFGYLTLEYGVEFLAAQGTSTGTESAARHIAELINLARERRLPLFLENVADSRLLAQIGRETGRDPSARLYSDALSAPDGPAATYLALMRYNTRTLVSAMLAE